MGIFANREFVFSPSFTETLLIGHHPVAANTARDVGARLMALTIWGSQAAGGPYAAIAALTNIPATLLSFLIYETFLGSSSRSMYFAFSYGGASKKLT